MVIYAYSDYRKVLTTQLVNEATRIAVATTPESFGFSPCNLPNRAALARIVGSKQEVEESKEGKGCGRINAAMKIPLLILESSVAVVQQRHMRFLTLVHTGDLPEYRSGAMAT